MNDDEEESQLHPAIWDCEKKLWTATVEGVTITHSELIGLHDKAEKTFGDDITLIFHVGDWEGFEEFAKELRRTNRSESEA